MKLTSFILFWMLCVSCSIAFAQSSRPEIIFSNEKAEPLVVYYVPAMDDSVESAMIKVGNLESGKSLTQMTTIGHHFLVKLADGSLEVPVIIDSSQQKITFGDTHSMFRIRGWKIHLNDRLWVDKTNLTERMLELLKVQLERVEKVVPEKALEQIRTVPIWLSPPYQDERPTAAYHPNAGWLEANGRLVEMAKCVEITNVDRFKFETIRMPYLLLHELAHAYHDQVLGFRNPKVREVFEKAVASGGYENVDRFTGKKIVKDKAYALSNAKEYFAESTEAYFGKNDFFPFDRHELKTHDREMHDLVAKLWGAKGE